MRTGTAGIPAPQDEGPGHPQLNNARYETRATRLVRTALIDEAQGRGLKALSICCVLWGLKRLRKKALFLAKSIPQGLKPDSFN